MTQEQKGLILLSQIVQEAVFSLSDIKRTLQASIRANFKDTLYDLYDAQSILRINRSTLNKIRKQGKLSSIRLGRKSYVLGSELEMYLQQNKTI
jgi:hypothetical protein